MQYKPIENYQVENAILKKDLNLCVTSSFFHAFTLMAYKFQRIQVTISQSKPLILILKNLGWV
jgi:hypothetical protein